jgi:hydrogenase nickel incorporation protein HypA/HybF
MHELGITQEIVELAAGHARGAKVVRVVVAIGKLTAVLPDAVRFCFELCSAGTVVEGAELEINEVPGRARCRACAAEVALDQPWGQCAACGNADLEWLAGRELTIKTIEVI